MTTYDLMPKKQSEAHYLEVMIQTKYEFVGEEFSNSNNEVEARIDRSESAMMEVKPLVSHIS